jgi:hypothetical protein
VHAGAGERTRLTSGGGVSATRGGRRADQSGPTRGGASAGRRGPETECAGANRYPVIRTRDQDQTVEINAEKVLRLQAAPLLLLGGEVAGDKGNDHGRALGVRGKAQACLGRYGGLSHGCNTGMGAPEGEEHGEAA